MRLRAVVHILAATSPLSCQYLFTKEVRLLHFERCGYALDDPAPTGLGIAIGISLNRHRLLQSLDLCAMPMKI
jgi:hypothetical protein